MEARKKLIAGLAIGGLVFAACGGSESAVRTKNAALGKPPVAATGSCDDGEMIEGLDDDDCVIAMKIGRSTRKFSLQLLNTDGDWDTIGSALAKKGSLKIDVPATDDDGVWLDGMYTYRIFAARSGKSPEYISADFDVLYGTEVVADDTTAMTDEEFVEDSGASPEMQTMMDDIEKPTTRFDDNCTKIFDAIDCALMFRPGKGPDFVTLGKSKWVKMCSTLLKRGEGDCEMEFKFATQMTKSSGGNNNPNAMQPGVGGMQPGPGLDPVKLAAACAAIGMPEGECRAAMQAGPMAALQKFGDKAETFCKAYGGKSCIEMMAGGLASGGMQPPMSGQPGTMQPGQPGTMQPPTPGKG